MVSFVALNGVLTNMSFFNPINLVVEKEKFFGSSSYNPVFEYKKIDFPVDSYRSFLEGVLSDNSNPIFENSVGLRSIIQDSARYYLLLIDLLLSRGAPSFSFLSEQVYPLSKGKIYSEALSLLENNKLNGKDKNEKLKSSNISNFDSSKNISAFSAVEKMKSFLEKLDFNFDVVVEENMVSRAKVDSFRRILFLNKDAFFSEFDIRKILVHEIGVHASRFNNGKNQSSEIFSAGTAFYTETEEGLATFAENASGVLKNDSLVLRAGLFYASHLALSSSFREVFDKLCDFFDSNKAFSIALRVKRGLTDTSKSGCFTKDACYFSGYHKILSLVEKYGENYNNNEVCKKGDENENERINSNLNILMGGRVSLLYLPILRDLIKEKKFVVCEGLSWSQFK